MQFLIYTGDFFAIPDRLTAIIDADGFDIVKGVVLL
jgi:hypothetical protein